MLYGVDVAGDERYDFRIRDLAGLETGEPVSELPEQFTGIGSACFTPDGQWVFWVELDDSWRPLAVWRHRVGTAVESDVCEKPMNGSGWALASVLMSAIS